MRRTFYALLLAGVATICAVISSRAAEEGALSGTFTDWRRHPAIGYSSQPSHDPVAELSGRISTGFYLRAAVGGAFRAGSVAVIPDADVD